MRTIVKYLFLIIPFFGCDNANTITNSNSTKTPDTISLPITDSNFKHDTLKNTDSLNVRQETKVSSSKDTLTTIKYVYVTDNEGISYFSEPDSSSKRIGKFEYATKLKIVEDDKMEPNNNWLKVCSGTDSSDLNWVSLGYDRHIGYIPNKSVKDSSEIDFTQLPILFNSLKLTQVAIESYEELALTILKIDSLTFYNYKNSYSSKISRDTSIKFKPGGYFTIKTKTSNLKFVCGENYRRPCYTYNGSLKPINVHIIGQYGESVYYQYLLDENDFTVLGLDNYYDGGTGPPLLSPKNTKMLSFASCDLDQFEFYDCRSRIALYDLTGITNLKELKKIKYYCSTKWEINDFAWVDENSFVLEIGDEIRINRNNRRFVKNKRYLKAIIK